jgi:hypothetical protein
MLPPVNTPVPSLSPPMLPPVKIPVP